MIIPESINKIEIYYDGHCAMCCTFQEWLNRQDRAFDVNFVTYQSSQAEVLFPGVTKLDPDQEMIVRTDQGEVFRGAEGWVLCLLSCETYQHIAKRLAAPLLLPVAKKSCSLIASNRISISKIMFNKKDKALANTLHQMPSAPCESSCEKESHEDIPDGLL